MQLPPKLDHFLTTLDEHIKAGFFSALAHVKATMLSLNSGGKKEPEMPAEAPEVAPITNNELRKRIASGVVLGSIVIIFTVLGNGTFALLVTTGWYILISEWYALTKTRGVQYTVLGALYITSALLALTYLRLMDLNILLAVLAIVWTGDIAAYFVGKKYGKHKIAPTISPGKSWEGLAGSVVASAIMGAALGHVAPIPHAFLGAVFAVLGLGGDLFESSLKRHAGVKDSGTLIPGHGGLFDRVDALLPCAIFGAVALYIRLGMQ